VTAENFLSVLSGQEPTVIGTSGKVIKSGPEDRVFVFYADHGAPGVGNVRTYMSRMQQTHLDP
jgi:legumain